MAKSKILKNYSQVITLLALCLFFFLPFFINPNLLIHKDNDLGRTSVLHFNFIRNSFFVDKDIPLWRPEQLMGETFIGNPVFSVMYPLNILFLIFPIGIASVLYYYFHIFAAGVFTYILGRSYSLSKLPSLLAAIFYAFSANTLLHISAGHITLIAALSYFPLLFLATRKLLKNFSSLWVLIAALSLVFMLLLFATILYYSIIFSFVYIFYYLFTNHKQISTLFLKEKFATFFAVFLIFLGLSAFQLFPEIEFGPLSTRSSLKLEDVALPLWNIKRLITSALFPYLKFNDLDHESFLYLGFVPTILCILGFIYLPKFKKIILAIFAIFTVLFIAGLSTPVFPLAYKILPYLEYSRITTRLWFIVALISALLSAQAVERFKNNKIVYLLILIFLTEVFYIGYRKILSVPDLYFGNKNIYEYIKNDHDIFRVYCTTYCFNPQQATVNGFQVLHGESPIQDKNIVNFLENAGGYTYQNFAVIFPPYQVWQQAIKPQPNADLLGKANVKYIASTYPILSNQFKYIAEFENLYLYINSSFKKRAYFKNSDDEVSIEKYSPNKIAVSFVPSLFPRNLILSEKFYPGWYVLMDQKKFKVNIEQPLVRSVIVPPNTTRAVFVYQPKSFQIGKIITFSTILFLALYFWYVSLRLHRI